jgi:hypothetical protein
MLILTIASERFIELKYQGTITGSENRFATDFAIPLLEKTANQCTTGEAKVFFDYYFKSGLLGRKLR